MKKKKLKTLNAETIEAIQEGERGGGTEFNGFADMLAKLHEEDEVTNYRFLYEGDYVQAGDQYKNFETKTWQRVPPPLIGRKIYAEDGGVNGINTSFRRRVSEDSAQEVKLLSEDELENLLEKMKMCAYLMADLPPEIRIEIESEKETGDLLIHVDGLETEQGKTLDKNFGDWVYSLIKEIEEEEGEEGKIE